MDKSKFGNGPTDPPVAAPNVAPAGMDPQFGDNGMVTVRAGFRARARPGLRQLPNRSLLLTAVERGSLRIARLHEDGTTDGSFGDGGVVSLPLDVGPFGPTVTVQPDGRILVGCVVDRLDPGEAWLLLRLLPDGALDTTFSGDGMLRITFPGHHASSGPRQLLIDAQSRILVVGAVGKGPEPKKVADALAMARLHSDGSIDRTFGDEGKTVVALPGPTPSLRAVTGDAAGNVLACGAAFVTDTGWDMFVARFDAGGRPDPSFGVNGSTLVDFGIGPDEAVAATVQPDGAIVVVGEAATGSQTFRPTLPAVARLLPDGRLDATFGIGGRVRIETGVRANPHHASAVRVLTDGRIAVAGWFFNSNPAGANDSNFKRSQSFVATLRPDGTPDVGMGEHGITMIPAPGVVSGGMVLRTDDRLVLLCHDDVLARLLTRPPAAASIALTLGTPHPQVGPGPVPFRATVRNSGPAIATPILNLAASKRLRITSSTGASTVTVKPDGLGATATLQALVPGASATVDLTVEASGREGRIVVVGAVGSASPEHDRNDNRARAEVLTLTDATF